jgi:alpha-1,6-mannosyltransferase
LPRLARRVGVAPSIAVWLGVLNPLLLWHLVAGMHNDGIMLGLLLAGLEIALREPVRPARVVAGVVLLAVAANVKIVAGAALCVVAVELTRRWGGALGRGVLVALGLLAAFAAISVAIAAGTGLGFGWVGTLDTPTLVHSWLAPTNELGFLAGGIGALFGAHLTDAAISVSIHVGEVLGAVVVIRLLWSHFRGRRGWLSTLGLVFTTMLVAGPVVQPWYLLWAILPLAASISTERNRRILAVLSAVFAVLLPPTAAGAGTIVLGYAVAVVLLVVAVAAFRARFAYPVEGDLSEMSAPDGGRQ